MIAPGEVKYKAAEKERENFKFRTFLRNRAEEEILDHQFLTLHNELFANYDCSRCRNCCKEYHGEIPREDLDKAAEYLGLSVAQFTEQYLEIDEITREYRTKNKPCDFLLENGECKLGNYRPQSCKNYPHTNQPERLHSLLSVLDVVSVCPVAYEIFERLKKKYGFVSR